MIVLKLHIAKLEINGTYLLRQRI